MQHTYASCRPHYTHCILYPSVTSVFTSRHLISQFLSAIFRPSKYMLFQPHKHTSVLYNLHPAPTIRLGRQAMLHILTNIS